jgi:uncharacterized protein (DUF488 family)
VDPAPKSTLLWTIGHSSRTLPELLALLESHGIAGVADVRRVPRSRRHPQFGRERLEAALAAAGIRYDHRVGLGGMRTPDGHRSLIADALVARRVEVEHILDLGATQRHTIRATARIDGDRVSYPPAQTELGISRPKS